MVLKVKRHPPAYFHGLWYSLAIRFEKKHKGRYDLEGLCKDKYGEWVNLKDLVLLKADPHKDSGVLEITKNWRCKRERLY